MPNKKSFAFFVRHFLSVFQIDFFLTVKYDFLFNAFLGKTFQKKIPIQEPLESVQMYPVVTNFFTITS